jgi:amino acid transporter
MKLKKNMGTLDRIIRLVIAAAVAVLYFTGNLSGLAAIILGILVIIFVVTSFVGFCPLYLLFGLTTRKQ